MKKFLFSLSIILLSLCVAVSVTSCGKKKEKRNRDKEYEIPRPQTLPADHAHFCPLPTDIKKVDMNWAAEGGWKSNNPSFSTAITMYVGAQWKGIRNGKVTCIYRGNNDDFPITLQTNRYITVPPIVGWTDNSNKRTKQKIFNCVAPEPKFCPFPKKTHKWQPPAG